VEVGLVLIKFIVFSMLKNSNLTVLLGGGYVGDLVPRHLSDKQEHKLPASDTAQFHDNKTTMTI
jgi:hypothetical protein